MLDQCFSGAGQIAGVGIAAGAEGDQEATESGSQMVLISGSNTGVAVYEAPVF